jgi:hypothetical protein
VAVVSFGYVPEASKIFFPDTFCPRQVAPRERERAELVADGEGGDVVFAVMTDE